MRRRRTRNCRVEETDTWHVTSAPAEKASRPANQGFCEAFPKASVLRTKHRRCRFRTAWEGVCGAKNRRKLQAEQFSQDNGYGNCSAKDYYCWADLSNDDAGRTLQKALIFLRLSCGAETLSVCLFMNLHPLRCSILLNCAYESRLSEPAPGKQNFLLHMFCSSQIPALENDLLN